MTSSSEFPSYHKFVYVAVGIMFALAGYYGETSPMPDGVWIGLLVVAGIFAVLCIWALIVVSFLRIADTIDDFFNA